MQSVTFLRAGLCLLALGGASAAALTPQSTQPPRGRVHTSIARVGLDAYAHMASEVVHARVVGVQARFPVGRMARTAYTLEVLSALKGLERGEIVVEVAGASRDDFSFDVPDAPRFAFGEELVLFLWTDAHTRETGILGLAQGVYRVSRDEQNVPRVFGAHARAESVAQFLSRVGDLAARPFGRTQKGR